MKTQITIAGVESNNGRIILKSDDHKTYSFFLKKQDGNATLAAEGFGKIRPLAGDTVIAEVNEKQGVSKTGSQVTFRNIAFFYTDGAQMETVQAPRQIKSNVPNHDEIPTIHIEDIGSNGQESIESMPSKDILRRLEELENRLLMIENIVTGVGETGNDINIKDIPF